VSATGRQKVFAEINAKIKDKKEEAERKAAHPVWSTHQLEDHGL